MVVVVVRSISLFDQSTPLRAMFWLWSVGGWWGLIWLRAAPLGVSGQPASGSQTDWLVPVTPPQSGYWLLTTGVILSALTIGRCEVDICQYYGLVSGVCSIIIYLSVLMLPVYTLYSVWRWSWSSQDTNYIITLFKNHPLFVGSPQIYIVVNR